MKTTVTNLLNNAKKSTNIENLRLNVKTDFINLYSMDEELVDIHKIEILSIINDLINLKDFEKSQKNIIEFSNTFLKDIMKIEKSKMKPLVKLENTGNKELEDKMNEILEVFHKITKTHENKLNEKGKTSLEVREFSNKEKAIIILCIEKIGQEEFNKLGVSWNPYIGLFIPSKEGFDKEKQVLMMSHLDLVTPFENVHRKVENGEMVSALTIMDDQEINENTIIAGSLDNTMTNAVLLNNILNNRFDNNVNALFETDEENKMNGTKFFFQEEKEDFWNKISLNDGEIKLEQIEAPSIKKDLKVVNLDVTMGYEEPCAIETRNFTKESSDAILEKHNVLGHKKYGYDDSTLTVKEGLLALSYCVNVGTKIEPLENGKNKFSGGCHSMNTFSSIENVLTYSDLMPELVHSISKELNLELNGNPLRELKDVDYENFDYIFNDEKGIFVDEVFEALNEKYKLEDYKKIPTEIVGQILNELKEYTLNINEDEFLSLRKQSRIERAFLNSLTNEELIVGIEKFYKEDEEVDIKNAR